jgi:hypothetical protein
MSFPTTPVGRRVRRILEAAGVPPWLAGCISAHAERYSAEPKFFAVVRVFDFAGDAEWFGANSEAAIGPALADGRPAIVRLVVALHALRAVVCEEAASGPLDSLSTEEAV